MFWRFGAYANISTIDTILEKPDFTLEDLLDEGDLIQELKQHNSKLVEYLREPEVLESLLEYVVTPRLEPVATPDDDEETEDEAKDKGISLPFSRPRASSRATDSGKEEDGERKRNRYAFVAAEVLSSDNWSIYEALMESRAFLRTFWQFLKRPIPLDPLQASYFTKVNESLFDKKTDEMLELLKSLEDAVPDMLKHVDCPMIMDLLLKIISLERTESGQGIIEWLYTQDVMPTLLSFLGPEHSWATQTSAGDFMKAIITVSANASQNEQTCIGPNELTRQLVSQPCVEQLIKYMLGGGNPLTVGVGIIIEVIRKNNSDYDPDVVAEPNSTPSSRDPIYLGTLLRLFAQHVPDFMNLIMNAPAQKERLDSTFGEKIEPLGFDRFKTCELMAELLHCSNMALLNEVGSEELIAARDVERQRLRKDGKLGGFRSEEAPQQGDDLAMRLSHSSAPDEGRKLEVTNVSADDDGFEEVTHGGDEDTSHEFVRAEEDMPDLPEVPSHPPTSSFLDKDDDDFVDEPLSSPRLNVRDMDVKVEELGFDDPELMVAPLSPSKLKPAEAADGSASEGETKSDGPAEKVTGASVDAEPVQTSEPGHKEQEASVASDQSATPAIPTPTVSEPEGSATDEAEIKTGDGQSPAPEGMSPHAEDTPAPLFFDPSSATAADSSDGGKALQPVQPAEDTKSNEKESDTIEHETGEASIIVGHATEPSAAAKETMPNPVVGDYLKMQFVEYRVVPTILSFFFKYPWNNFLHNVVYDVVQQVFNGPMDRGYNPTVAISLFEAADVTSQIINGQTASEMSQAKTKTRMGYMGHLTLIAEELVKFTERHPPELLSDTVLDRVMSQDWINYVEGALAETRERDNAILGGVRPEVAMSNRAAASGLSSIGLSLGGSGGGGGGGGMGGNSQAGSNALADAGLNGSLDLSEGGGNGVGPFAISAGTLMSGFGSSSDEDDDEEQESEEDVNNEFRAYTDPLNANQSSSLIPPSIPPPPPPPPPLNVPPSRARRQLAARLAMNKRNAAAAAAGGEEGASGPSNGGPDGESTGRSGGDDDNDDDASAAGFSVLKGLQAAPELTSAGDDRSWELRDPFADYDDDDDDDGRGAGDGSGSDDGDVGARSSGWNRGSWWRGVVRTARRGGSKRGGGGNPGGSRSAEKFGDGRDSDDDSGEEGEVDEDMDDEEFGDFAMPEAGGPVTGIDPAREKVLLKPLPLHPATSKPGGSSFGSLWPFSTQAFGVGIRDKGKGEAEATAEATTEAAGAADSGGSKDSDAAAEAGEPGPEISAEPLELEAGETVVGEDGKKIDRAVEAKRRTSIEDPDEDDVGAAEVVVEKGEAS